MKFRTMFHIGRPVVQFLIILMIVSVMMMTSKYYQVRTFEQVVACGQPANIFSMNVVVGHEETMTIKDQKKVFIKSSLHWKKQPSYHHLKSLQV